MQLRDVEQPVEAVLQGSGALPWATHAIRRSLLTPMMERHVHEGAIELQGMYVMSTAGRDVSQSSLHFKRVFAIRSDEEFDQRGVSGQIWMRKGDGASPASSPAATSSHGPTTGNVYSREDDNRQSNLSREENRGSIRVGRKCTSGDPFPSRTGCGRGSLHRTGRNTDGAH